MNIAGVIQQSNKSNLCYDTSAITLSELLSQSDGIHPIIIAMIDDSSNYHYYNFSKMRTNQVVLSNNVTDWTTLETYINNLANTVLDQFKCVTLVPKRMLKKIDNKTIYVNTPFTSNTQAELDVYSVETNCGINVSYGSHILPAIRNNKQIKWKLNDIVFGRQNNGCTINFNNTIPFVDGVACYPFVYNDELYALEGSKLLANNSNTSKNVVLVDFSKFGNLVTHRLSDCTRIAIDGFETEEHAATVSGTNSIKHNTKINTYVNDNIHISFSLPSNAVSGIPMVCILGRLFTPYDSNVTISKSNKDTTVIELYIPRKTLERIFASNLQKYNKTISNTQIIPVSIKNTICDLFRNREEDVNATLTITNAKYNILNDKNYEVNDSSLKATSRVWTNGDLLISYNTAKSRWEIKNTDGTIYYYGKYIMYYNNIEYDKTSTCLPWSNNLEWYDQDDNNDLNIVLTHNVSEIVTMKYADECVPFVSILVTDKDLCFNTYEPRKSIGKDKAVFDKYVGGLLFNKKTRDLIDYTKVDYDDETLITIASYKPLNLLTKTNIYNVGKGNTATGDNASKVYRDGKYNHYDQFENLKDIEDLILFDVAYTDIVTETEEEVQEDVSTDTEENSEGTDLSREISNHHTDLEDYEDEEQEEDEEKEVKVTYVTALTLEVTGDTTEVNGTYTLEDATVSGLNRVWVLKENDVVKSKIAYDSVRHWWYIGLEDNHIYESVVSHTGSSPWHGTVTWTYVGDEE